MNEQEQNGTVALHTINEEPPKQALPQMQMSVTPQGIMLNFPVNLGLDNEMMKQLVKVYLGEHPELVQEIVQEAITQKQQELKIIQMVKQSRND